MINVIKKLAAEGTTMIIVTHDMQLAADIADQIVFLYEGKIAEQGTPNELLKHPKTERLLKFLN